MLDIDELYLSESDMFLDCNEYEDQWLVYKKLD